MEGSKRTTTRIDHLYSSTKNKQKNKKGTTLVLMAENLFSNNTSNRFKFIMAPTHGKTCGLGRRNGATTLR